MMKKQQMCKKNKHLEAHYKLFLGFLMIMLISVSVVSAFEFDNRKEISKEKGLAGYNNIKIGNFFGLGEVLWSGTLDSNTEICTNNCEAIQTIQLHKDGVLVEEVIFKTLQYDGTWVEQPVRSYQVYVDGNPYELGTEIKAGTYEVRLEGNKKASRTVDWIYKTQGETLDEWATWGGLDLFAGTLAYYPLDETPVSASELANINDSIEGLYNLTEIFGIQGVNGIIGNGFRFNVTDTPPINSVTYINDSFPDLQENGSISVWINYNKTATPYSQYLMGDGRTDGFEIIKTASFPTSSDYHLAFIMENGSTNSETLVTSNIVSNDTWYHFVFTWNITTMEIYQDGVSINKNSSNGIDGVNAMTKYSVGADFNENDAMNGTIDELGIWNRSLTASEVAELYNVGSGLAYNPTRRAGFSSIVLNSPIEQANSTESVIFNCSANPVGALLSNISLLHNASGTWEINQSNLTVSNSTNQTTFTAPFSLGKYKWTCKACDSDGDCGFGTENRTLNIKSILVNNQSYTTPIVASTTDTIAININYSDTIHTNIAGYLIYDGVSTLGTKTGSGDNTIFTASKTIPLVTGTYDKQFYWNFTLTDSIGGTSYANSSLTNQTVNGIILTFCNVTYDVPYVNFTFEDELLGTSANGTFDATFEYWVTESDASDTANYSFQNLTENPSYSFCVSPNYTSINVNMTTQYGGEDYSDRTYYFNNATLTNSTNNITLYQLNSSEAVKFFINVKDGLENFAGATITISKLFVGEGVYKTTGIRTTDDAGEFIEYLELDQDYRFAITRGGESFGVIDKTSSCAEAPCEITLELDRDLADLWKGFDGYYAGNVQYAFRYNDTSKIASLVFIDTTGLAQYMRLEIQEVNLQNSTKYYACNNTLYSSSGTINCDMTGESGDFIARAYISRSPEKIVEVWKFVINLIKDTLGLDGVLIALLLIITIALVGAWSPTAGIVLTSFAVLMMKFLGFVAFGWTTVTLIFVLAIIIIMKVKQ